MTASTRRFSLSPVRSLVAAAAALSLALPGMVSAQTVSEEESAPNVGLDIPSNATFLRKNNPNVRTATAVINSEIVTGTDVDQRLALLVSQNNVDLPEDQIALARQQVLRNLIDEALQIQAAKAADPAIEVTPAEIDQAYAELARRNGATDVAAFDAQLRELGSSAASVKRQIEAEYAWNRLISRNISPYVNVSAEEASAVVDRLVASQGQTEYRVGEIYLSATPENQDQVLQTVEKIGELLQQGTNFQNVARQFSEASTASVGGDLGFVFPEQLPGTMAQALATMERGQIAGPVIVPGGYSIILLIDKRQVLGSNTDDTNLSMKQIAIDFAPGTSEAKALDTVQKFDTAVSAMAGCGQAEAIAQQIGASVVSRDIRAGDLPPALKEQMLSMQVGQVTPPLGSTTEGVRAFVLCGRDDPKAATLPSVEQITNSIEQQRIAQRAQTYMRDLRRDALIEYN